MQTYGAEGWCPDAPPFAYSPSKPVLPEADRASLRRREAVAFQSITKERACPGVAQDSRPGHFRPPCSR